MTLTVLNVAYPFAPVTADPIGGAEQILSVLDRAITARGGRSLVAAQAGSEVAGELLPLPAPAGDIDPAAKCIVYAHLRALLAEAVRRHRPDVVHLHGVDFPDYLPPDGPPVLVTLHLPLAWYRPGALRPARPDLWLTPVSHDQARRGAADLVLTQPIENGVEISAFPPARKRRFALALGRICPEKGFHLALDAARAADIPLLLAGKVFPYAEHRRYFEAEIRPRLDRFRRWIGPVTGAPKRRLLSAAACLVAPSLAPESSSMVAREALAAGAPVVALRSGALAEVIEPGRTGVLVDDPKDLAWAILAARCLRPETCRQAAAARFSAERMVEAYLAAYQALAAGQGLPLLRRNREP